MNSKGPEGTAAAFKTAELAATAAAKGVADGSGTKRDGLFAAVYAAGGLEMSKNQAEAQAAKAAAAAANEGRRPPIPGRFALPGVIGFKDSKPGAAGLTGDFPPRKLLLFGFFPLYAEFTYELKQDILQ